MHSRVAMYCKLCIFNQGSFARKSSVSVYSFVVSVSRMSQEEQIVKRRRIIEELEAQSLAVAPDVQGTVLSVREKASVDEQGGLRRVLNVIVISGKQVLHLYAHRNSFAAKRMDYVRLASLKPGNSISFPRGMVQNGHIQLSFNIGKVVLGEGAGTDGLLDKVEVTALSLLNHDSEKKAGTFLTQKLRIASLMRPDTDFRKLICSKCQVPLPPGPCRFCFERVPEVEVRMRAKFVDNLGLNLFLSLTNEELDKIGGDTVDIATEDSLAVLSSIIEDLEVQLILSRKVDKQVVYVEKIFVSRLENLKPPVVASADRTPRSPLTLPESAVPSRSNRKK